MLRFVDKVLTRLIDWLYLKRTKVRLQLAVKESAAGEAYKSPVSTEVVDDCLKEFGLSVAELSRNSAFYRAKNIDANMATN
jgi:hypothetical protein